MVAGHRLRLHYAATDEAPRWRTVDPDRPGHRAGQGLSARHEVRGGPNYRLSRILAAQELPEPAQRPHEVDLDRLWRERCAQFLAGSDHLVVQVRMDPARREDLLGAALAVRAVGPDPDGRLCVEVTFQDTRHAEWALWQLGPDAEAVSPPSLRAALHRRAAAMAERYAV